MTLIEAGDVKVLNPLTLYKCNIRGYNLHLACLYYHMYKDKPSNNHLINLRGQQPC